MQLIFWKDQKLPQIPFRQRKSLRNNATLLLTTSLSGCDQRPAQFRHDDLAVAEPSARR